MKRRKKRRSQPTQDSGHKFKSRFEHKVWKGLSRKKKLQVEYEPERITYVTQRKYVPDLKFKRKDGSVWYLELKGWLRPEDRTKMIAVKAFNPDLDIRILFAQDNFLYKGSKSRYSDWARKNGFQYAFGTQVPMEWLNE